MNTQEYRQRWAGLMLEVTSGMAEWRQHHPQATLRAIEAELDQRQAHVRARIVEDLARASTAADWGQAPQAEQPVCPHCGSSVKPAGGKTKRQIQTHGGETVVLERGSGVCPTGGSGWFPPG